MTEPLTPRGAAAAAPCWAGLWLPLVTPMRPDGGLDLPALSRLVAHLAAAPTGLAGFVACGSTGEAALLSADEQDQVLATTLAAAAGRSVLMGLAGPAAAPVAQRAQALAERHPAVAGFLLPPPAYLRPSQAGLLHFFHRVAEATPRPLVAYDIPARTGVRLQPDTLRALAEHPQIQAVKDCSGDRGAAEAVLTDGRLALLCGNDDELFDQLARGAAGGITASALVAPAAFLALQQHLARHRLPQARALWHRLAPLVNALFAEPNPTLVKAALADQGLLPQPTLREPLAPAGATAVAAVRRALASLADGR